MSRQIWNRRVQTSGQGGITQFGSSTSSTGGPTSGSGSFGSNVLIEQAIYALLKASSGVTDIVAGKIFSGVAKQTAVAPYVVYRTPPEGARRITRTIDGDCTLVRDGVLIFSVGRTYGEAAELDAAIEDALDEYAGTVTNTDASPEESIDIQQIRLDSPAHGHQYVDDTKLHEFLSKYECDFTDPRKLD